MAAAAGAGAVATATSARSPAVPVPAYVAAVILGGAVREVSAADITAAVASALGFSAAATTHVSPTVYYGAGHGAAPRGGVPLPPAFFGAGAAAIVLPTPSAPALAISGPSDAEGVVVVLLLTDAAAEESQRLLAHPLSGRLAVARGAIVLEVAGVVPNLGAEAVTSLLIPTSAVTFARTRSGERRKLGEGGFGVVYEGVFAEQPVAIKVLKRPPGGCNVANVRALLREASTHYRFRHAFVLPLHGLYADPLAEPPEFGLVTPLSRAGDVATAVFGRDSPADAVSTLPLARRLRWLWQMAVALAHMHALGTVHTDVKPDNALLSDDDDVLLCDFGLAHFRSDWAAVARTAASAGSVGGRPQGSPAYMCPKLLLGGSAARVTPASDVYSLAIVGYELSSGRKAYQHGAMFARGSDFFAHIEAGRRPATAAELATLQPAGLGDLLSDMWASEPAARPSMAEVVRRLEPLLASVGVGGRLAPGTRLTWSRSSVGDAASISSPVPSPAMAAAAAARTAELEAQIAELTAARDAAADRAARAEAQARNAREEAREARDAASAAAAAGGPASARAGAGAGAGATAAMGSSRPTSTVQPLGWLEVHVTLSIMITGTLLPSPGDELVVATVLKLLELPAGGAVAFSITSSLGDGGATSAALPLAVPSSAAPTPTHLGKLVNLTVAGQAPYYYTVELLTLQALAAAEAAAVMSASMPAGGCTVCCTDIVPADCNPRGWEHQLGTEYGHRDVVVRAALLRNTQLDAALLTMDVHTGRSRQLLRSGPIADTFAATYAGARVAVATDRVYRATPAATVSALAATVHKQMRQLRLHTSLHHPVIVQCYGVVLVRDAGEAPRLRLVLEFCAGGPLFERLIDRHSAPPGPALRRKWMLQIATAVAHMHARRIVHTDIKCENVWLTATDGDAKLSDLDFAFDADTDDDTTFAPHGSPLYMAPEVLASIGLHNTAPINTMASDVYSLGFALWEVATAQRALDRRGIDSLPALQAYIAGGGRIASYRELAALTPAGLGPLIRAMTESNPATRPTAGAVVERLSTMLSAV